MCEEGAGWGPCNRRRSFAIGALPSCHLHFPSGTGTNSYGGPWARMQSPRLDAACHQAASCRSKDAQKQHFLQAGGCKKGGETIDSKWLSSSHPWKARS
eukprot:362135-Chlamydomonas_euryale.AAC.4